MLYYDIIHLMCAKNVLSTAPNHKKSKKILREQKA